MPSLYGYINGGAELYLEYGFDTLISYRSGYARGGIFKVEVYRMKDPGGRLRYIFGVTVPLQPEEPATRLIIYAARPTSFSSPRAPTH
ncbi:MAG: DUF6599 family protein [Bacteroidales bacterium]|nr:DUF6599 family protein [Bacteroidales bacterium]